MFSQKKKKKDVAFTFFALVCYSSVSVNLELLKKIITNICLKKMKNCRNISKSLRLLFFVALIGIQYMYSKLTTI